MREFLEKLNSNKALKIGFCVVVAIPIWLIGMWLFPNKDMQDNPADVVIVQGPSATEENQENGNSTTDNTTTEIIENLNYTYQTDSECVRVVTLGDIQFDEKYIEETFRKQMFNELIETGFFENVSYEQTAKNLKVEKAEGIDGYVETGAIDGNIYAAGYSKSGKNVFFCITVAKTGGTSEQTLLTGVRNSLKVTNTYILQARQDAAQQAQQTEPTIPSTDTTPTEEHTAPTTEPTTEGTAQTEPQTN